MAINPVKYEENIMRQVKEAHRNILSKMSDGGASVDDQAFVSEDMLRAEDDIRKKIRMEFRKKALSKVARR